MAKVTNPITLSEHFDVDPSELTKRGVLDVKLAIDTNLFIDPLLLELSDQPEMRVRATKEYQEYFERVISLLSTSTQEEDVAWRNAYRQLSFHEIPGTCLGYGKASTAGSAFGPYLTSRITRTGREIVGLGIRDPNVFVALALFEEGIGADRISDMATNVILSSLLEFNRRAIAALKLPSERHSIGGRQADLVTNPYARGHRPILLVPADILRPLPIASDWQEVVDSADDNDQLRARVNAHIGAIWEAKTRKGKSLLKTQALRNKDAFQTLLDAIYAVEPTAYSASQDPAGLLKWSEDAQRAVRDCPLSLAAHSIKTKQDVIAVVQAIIEQFKFLVETRGLWKSLYHDGRPHHESYAQRLFFSVGYSYCKANNVDVSPELDTGTGRVDFKFSRGFTARVLVETKLSTNRKVIEGYREQVRRYSESEEAIRAFYVVLDVGRMGNKDKALTGAKNEAARTGTRLSELVFVDALPKLSASQLA